jgi:hypothetical protein
VFETKANLCIPDYLPGTDGRTSTLLGKVLAGILIKSDTIWPISSGWIFHASFSDGW